MSPSLNEPTQIKRYKRTLCSFMGFVKKMKFSTIKTFKERELLKITPHNVYDFLCIKSYGKINPTGDDNPKSGRSNSVAYAKKALSYFMPNSNQNWDVRTKSGNPTKSVLVNNLLKAVKQKEVRKQGVSPQTMRALSIMEFKQIIQILRQRK